MRVTGAFVAQGPVIKECVSQSLFLHKGTNFCGYNNVTKQILSDEDVIYDKKTHIKVLY